MAQLLFIIALVVVNWWTFRAVSRYLSTRRRRARLAPDNQAGGQPAGFRAALATNSTDSPAPAGAMQSSARAFPIYGLAPGRAAAGVLEGLLRRVAGVTRAYVSPVTSLAYIDYLPAQVTEEQLAGAICSGGYRVGLAAQRFDWRHGHPG